MTEEEIRFVALIIGTSLPLDAAVSGYFKDKESPKAHAAKTLLWAGVYPCRHDVWGGTLLNPKDLDKHGNPKPYCSKEK